MKKLILLLILLSVFFSCSGQLIRLRSTGYAYANTNSNGEFKPWTDWANLSIVGSIDLDNERIKILNKWNDDFVLSGEPEFKKGLLDSDGDTYFNLSSYAIDQTGTKCTILISVWDNYNIIHIHVFYPNIKYVYEFKAIK